MAVIRFGTDYSLHTSRQASGSVVKLPRHCHENSPRKDNSLSPGEGEGKGALCFHYHTWPAGPLAIPAKTGMTGCEMPG